MKTRSGGKSADEGAGSVGAGVGMVEETAVGAVSGADGTDFVGGAGWVDNGRFVGGGWGDGAAGAGWPLQAVTNKVRVKAKR